MKSGLDIEHLKIMKFSEPTFSLFHKGPICSTQFGVWILKHLQIYNRKIVLVTILVCSLPPLPPPPIVLDIPF